MRELDKEKERGVRRKVYEACRIEARGAAIRTGEKGYETSRGVRLFRHL